MTWVPVFSEMRGSLHCGGKSAAFGRDDERFWGAWRRTDSGYGKGNGDGKGKSNGKGNGNDKGNSNDKGNNQANGNGLSK